LARSIRNLRRRNAHNKPYIPLRSLYKILTLDRVCEELKEAAIDWYHVEEVSRQIVKDGRRIFAILVLINRVSHVKTFLERDRLQDCLLPFNVQGLRNFEDEDRTFAVEFHSRQWELLAPCFSRGTICRQVDERCPLPFCKEKMVGDGAFGTVHEISLDADHQSPGDGFPKRVSCAHYVLCYVMSKWH
jgi:hypothetical protein